MVRTPSRDSRSRRARRGVRRSLHLETLERRDVRAAWMPEMATRISDSMRWVEEACWEPPITSGEAARDNVFSVSPPNVASLVADDVYEGNDYFSKASELGTLREPVNLTQLALVDRNDWFRFTLGESSGSEAYIEARFQQAAGNIDLELYDVRGQRLRSATGTQDDERISLSGLAPGTYLVRVFGNRGATNSRYSLNFVPGTPLEDDADEGNDTFGGAHDLGALQTRAARTHLKLADAQDWYRFRMDGIGTNDDYVAIRFQHAQGDLDLAIYNAQGARLRVAETSADIERISLAGLAAGTYTVRIYSHRGMENSNYVLEIDPATVAAVPVPGPTVPSSPPSSPPSGSPAPAPAPMPAPVPTPSPTPPEIYGPLPAPPIVDSPSPLPGPSPVDPVPSPTPTPTPAPVPDPTEPSGRFNIEFVFHGLTASQQAAFRQAASRWEAALIADLPDVADRGRAIDDLLIEVRSTAIDGVGKVLGQSGPGAFRSVTWLPYYGTMEFDTADLLAMEADGSLASVVMHEMGHVLGFGTLWEVKGLIAGAGSTNVQFVGPQATAEYARLTGRSQAGVPVESQGGLGTRDVHWSEAVFQAELMTPFASPGARLPLSRITVASLADLGYTVNMAAADTSTVR